MGVADVSHVRSGLLKSKKGSRCVEKAGYRSVEPGDDVLGMGVFAEDFYSASLTRWGYILGMLHSSLCLSY
jgi:hypothetical protein